MFAKKLTDEARDYIATQLALNIKHKTIQNDVKIKYGIDISVARIGQVQLSKRGGEVYAIAKESYLKTIQKDAAKFIQHKEKRQVILERLLEEILDSDPKAFATNFSNGLKERCELALKILKQAETESKEVATRSSIPSGSLVQYVEKQQLVMNNDSKNEVKTIDGGNTSENESANS